MNIRPLTAVAIGTPFALYVLGLLGRAFYRRETRRWTPLLQPQQPRPIAHGVGLC